MHTDEEIKEEAYRQLNKLSERELDDLADISIEIKMPAAKGEECRYTVFFERSANDANDCWRVRNIIRPDDLQDPQPKADKIE